MVKLKRESINLTKQNIEKIATIFPSAITQISDENCDLKKAIIDTTNPCTKHCVYAQLKA